jgi:membrane protein
MMRKLKSYFAVMKNAVNGWSEHGALRLGAGLAYYTVFSIAPLFVIVLAIAGIWFDADTARQELFSQLDGLVGPEGGKAIQAMVSSANKSSAGFWATVIATITLIMGATGVFVQLQDALNIIWQVRPKPGSGWRHFVTTRLLSFAMIVAIGFLLLVSLVVSAGLAAAGKFMNNLIPAHEAVWQIVNFLVSFGMITLLFATIFKYLPDVKIAWRDVWLGALFASLLFNVGKFALGFYLGRSSVASAYGAAGSLVVILLWVYYSSQTIFLAAEFTRARAKARGQRLEAVRGAEFVALQEVKPEQPR